MATPTSYLQTLAKNEALTFVASLEKVKDHLSGELEWMNQQVQQKTMQLQGIETLLSEATELGLVEDLSSATEVEISNVNDSVTSSGEGATSLGSDDDVSPGDSADSSLSDDTQPITTTSELTATSTNSEQEKEQNLTTSKPKRAAKPSAGSKTSAAKARKPNISSKSTGKAGKLSGAVDLRELLTKEFQGKTFTDSVAEILENASKPLHLNELLAQMYEGLSDQDYERARISLANVLSVGKKEGKWQNLGQGIYAGNAVATA